jgi:hypothetical protein
MVIEEDNISIDVCYNPCQPADYTCLLSGPEIGYYDCYEDLQDEEIWCQDKQAILSDLTDAGLGGFADWLDSDRDGTWYPECDVPEAYLPEPEEETNLEDSTAQCPIECG